MNRLTTQLQGTATLIRVNVGTPAGLAIARMYNVLATPTLLVFDGQGHVIYSHLGIPDVGAIVKVVEGLSPE